ncbi:MAG TPA: ATP-binding protein [Acidimicrobiales bacterium]|nr:ATP-binding protein [Acidimicrobiales bacterium]
MHRIRLHPEPKSALAARRFVCEELSASDEETLEVVLLLTSEVVTNAILYAGSEIDLTVDLRRGVVRIEVSDSSSRLPKERSIDLRSTSGRGLALVDALASSWGVERVPFDGKSVWFEVGLRTPVAHVTTATVTD